MQKAGSLSAAANPARLFVPKTGEQAGKMRQLDVADMLAGGTIHASFSQGSKFLLLSSDPGAGSSGDSKSPSYVVLSTLSWKPKFSGFSAGAVFLRDFVTDDFLLADQGVLDDTEAERIYSQYEAAENPEDGSAEAEGGPHTSHASRKSHETRESDGDGSQSTSDDAGDADSADHQSPPSSLPPLARFARFEDGCWVAELGERRKNIIVRCDGEERFSFHLVSSAERIFGGPILIAAGAEIATFYRVRAGGEAQFICQVSAHVLDVVWNEAGDLLCLVEDSGLTLLAYNFGLVEKETLSADYDDEEGCVDALELLASIPGKVSGCAFAQGGRILLYSVSGGEAESGETAEVRQLVLAELLEGGEEDSSSSSEASGSEEESEGSQRGDERPEDQAKQADPLPLEGAPYISLPVPGISVVVSILGCQGEFVYVLGEGSGPQAAALDPSASLGSSNTLGAADSAYGMYLCRVPLDHSIVEFRQVFSSKGVDAAIAHVRAEFADSPGNTMYAAEYLLRRGVEISQVFTFLPDPLQKLRLAEKHKRVDLALDVLEALEADLADDKTLTQVVGSETLARLAQAALKEGLVQDAKRLYGQVRDQDMYFLCGYLLGEFGDEEGENKKESRIFGREDRPDLSYMQAIASGDRDAAFRCLSSPAERAAFLKSNYREDEEVCLADDGSNVPVEEEGDSPTDPPVHSPAHVPVSDLREHVVADWKAELMAHGRAAIAEGITP